METATTIFSPANQLTHEVKQLASEIYGTPAWCHFPRWNGSGGSMWIESSSGSRLLTIDFAKREVRVPEWKDGGRTFEMPASWVDLYEGSLFDRNSGDALDREKFDAAMAQDEWKSSKS